jgi:hypothetical protein
MVCAMSAICLTALQPPPKPFVQATRSLSRPWIACAAHLGLAALDVGAPGLGFRARYRARGIEIVFPALPTETIVAVLSATSRTSWMISRRGGRAGGIAHACHHGFELGRRFPAHRFSGRLRGFLAGGRDGRRERICDATPAPEC